MRRFVSAILSSCGLMVALAGCGKGDQAKAAATGAPAPVPVGVVTLQAESVTLMKELPGRVAPFRVAEVRARVNGIVQKRMFAEGSDVKEGQALFKIDAAPYQATLESAQALVTKGEAAVAAAKTLNERYEKLVASNAVSKQEYDDAVTRVKSAQADVAGARAAVKSARINLDYTTVQAPIAGRIGRADVTEGAYVQAGTATLMATVQQLDKVYVDMTWSSTEAMRLRRSIEAGTLQQTGEASAKVVLFLEDGTQYAEPGVMQFADASVDPSTGSISLRAVVPNPKFELLPGMFVRAKIEEGTNPNAVLVPQRAVARDQNGRPTALVVLADNRVERRTLETDRVIGDAWLVTKGLAPGDRVIVEGIQKVRPGAVVVPGPVAAVAEAPASAGSALSAGIPAATNASGGAGSGSAAGK